MEKKDAKKAQSALVKKKERGRIPIPIDWNRVDELLEAGCKGTEISAMLGVSDDTLYLRCSKEKGLTFSIYSSQKRAKGDAEIKSKQYKLALSGDRGMLIWLGKQRLGQKDKHDESVSRDIRFRIVNYGSNPNPKTWKEEEKEKALLISQKSSLPLHQE